MSNKQNADYYELWKRSRNDEIQDYDTPTPPEDDEPDFLKDDPTIIEPQEYISDREVKTHLNSLRISEPIAEIATGLTDIVVPLLFVVFFKDAIEECVKLSESERETLTQSFAAFFADKDIDLSPGWALIITILTIYGAKAFAVFSLRKDKKDELELLRQQNELLKQSMESLPKTPVNG